MASDRRPARVTGRCLAKEWNVTANHALYHHRGTWYHHLREFPGALFDPEGYVRFESKEEYEQHPALQHQQDLHVERGIRSLPEYVRVNDK